MNPPAALQGAMGRERKPFTYTPGGIDLSQIKSERMAKRLMRNAMNPGVGETSPQLLSPTTPTTPVLVPNFNCLPVQVFPAFNLPANPKSLLRTRSTPSQNKDHVTDLDKSTKENNEVGYLTRPSSYKKSQMAPVEMKFCDNFKNETERPVSMFTMPSDYLGKTNKKIDDDHNGYIPLKNASSIENGTRPVSLYDLPTYVDTAKEWDETMNNKSVNTESNGNNEQKHLDIQTNNYNNNNTPHTKYDTDVLKNNKVISDSAKLSNHEDLTSNSTSNNSPQIDKSEVKVVKKQENHSEITESKKQNGENGDEAQAELTVKLPSKKSEAKTETKVETSKRTLADGSVEEVTKTTTKTTIDGVTEIKTKTETKTVPVETEVIEVVEGDEDEEENYVIQEDEEEEEEEEVHSTEQQSQVVSVKKGILKKDNTSEVAANGEAISVVKKEESSETTTTRKVVVVQNEEEEEEEESEYEEVEEDDEDEEEEKTQTNLDQLEENDEGIETEKDENFESTEEVIIEEEVEQNEVTEEEKTKGQSQILEITENTETEDIKEKQEAEIKETIVVESENHKEIVQTEIVNVDTEKKTEDIKQTASEIEKDEDSEYTDEEVESETEKSNNFKESVVSQETNSAALSEESTEVKEEIEVKTSVQEIQKETSSEQSEKPSETIKLSNTEKTQERSIPIHFDNVEDVEIKPIGQSLSKTQSEKTEITTHKDSQVLPNSLQTELHREEKVVVTNRITKTLDHNYEQLTQGLPTVKTYFAPDREKVPTSPQPSKPYQSSYTDELKTERRHSLLLDRLSMERQIPSSVPYQSSYSYTAPSQEPQREPSQEPQAEILVVSNVKPSTITNQQWYQHDSLRENVTYNDVSQSTPVSSWTQSSKPQIHVQAEPQYQKPTQSLQTPPIESHYVSPSEPQYIVPGQTQYEVPTQPQYQPPTQPQYQPPTQPQYQPPTQPQYQPPTQPQYQPPTQPQYQAPTQPQYQAPTPNYQTRTPSSQYEPSYQPQRQNTQSSYTDNYSKISSTQNFSKTSSYENTYGSSLPKSWGTNDSLSINEPTYVNDTYKSPVDNIQPYSLNKDTTQSHQSNNQYSSGYVPPPWEQDSSYSSSDYQFNNNNTSFYQTAQSAPTTPLASASPSWNSKPAGKFSKPAPKAYVPPAPNQSFVKPVSEVPQPKVPGRKTYYSEYERRYISVPEATYVPSETKHQHQPNPSPQYYQDNGETDEKEEHSWRKELREFTQKSSQGQYQQEASVTPWDEEKFVKTPTYTPTPSWSQTLNPRASCDRTFESEYVTQDWQKTSTIGRGRPLSYVQSNVETKVSERTRGVSMDRYNAHSYHSPIPSEHPPVQSQTLTPANAPHPKGHNPSVPGYRRDRSSAEPREMSSYQSPRYGHDPRLSPVQSRSFKYLQWITGTDHRS